MGDTNNDNASWDHAADVVIVGSGAAAMTTALYAHDHGASVLLLEKTDLYGGNSAMSGGALWIPNNPLMATAGVEDSREDALTYLHVVTRGQVSEEKLTTFVDTAPEMLEYLTMHSWLRMQCMLTYPDYYAEAAGGKPGGRALEPEHFDARMLGDEFLRMREPALQELVFGRMSMTATEGHHLLARHPGWIKLTAQIMARYFRDIRWRFTSKRDRCLSLGNALVAMLRRSLMDRDIALWLRAAVTELLVEDERVVGVVADRNGRSMRIRADKAVVLAAGGFEANQAMREQYLPQPSRAEWTSGSPGSTGDAIRLGIAIGADIDLMKEAWWGPTTVVPGEARARVLVVEKGLPGAILVNKRGQRFVNEAAPYSDVVEAMYARNSEEAPSVPAYLIFDAEYRRKYPLGPILQATQQPDWMLPRALRNDYLKKADNLEGLAARLGIDAAGLREGVERFNRHARLGEDPDFGRGSGGFDRYYGDDKVSPNPCLASVEKPPFYGIEVYAGEFGTKGGLKTDTRARVLDKTGKVIEGLYAVGNCSASVMGPTYPGAGGTIAPAMTFGYIAARDIAESKKKAKASDTPRASEVSGAHA